MNKLCPSIVEIWNSFHFHNLFSPPGTAIIDIGWIMPEDMAHVEKEVLDELNYWREKLFYMYIQKRPRLAALSELEFKYSKDVAQLWHECCFYWEDIYE